MSCVGRRVLGQKPVPAFNNKGRYKMAVSVSVSDLRSAFPEFASVTAYPNAYIQRFITQATMYISTVSRIIRDDVRVLAIEYMACHLMTLSAIDGAGNIKDDNGSAGGVLTNASIDSVSVGYQGVIARDGFEQWIQSTPYGKMYWALLKANTPVGIHYVGSPRVFGIR